MYLSFFRLLFRRVISLSRTFLCYFSFAPFTRCFYYPSLIWTFLLFSTFFLMECYRITSRARVIDGCTLSTHFVTLHDLLFSVFVFYIM
ncbi:hypothetical protein V1524DRAFT_179346 [Lipomyces starkeyi]